MTPDTEQALPRRYPGAKAFDDNEADRTLFFGRKKETDALLYRVLADDFVVVFGRSGHGKSSLIKAGLFHPLRDEGYFPFLVRLNDEFGSPVPRVYEAFDQAVADAGIEHDPGSRASLWHFFKTMRVGSEDDPLIPVVVFDQFEELFTIVRSKPRRQFIDAFADLVRGTPPAGVDAGDAKLPRGAPPVKVIVSMRGDYLWELESLPRDIPAIFRSRFRVEPLRASHARDCIVKPALDQSREWRSRPFRWTDPAVDKVIGYLSRGTEERERRKQVDPFLLQLICRAQEDRVLEDPDLSEIRPNPDPNSLDRVLEDYYEGCIRPLTDDLPWLARKRHEAAIRDLCEYDLIPHGHRVSLRQKQIRSVSDAALDHLVETRLLTRYKRSADSYYELSHDALVHPLTGIRQERQRKERARQGVLTSVAVGLLLLLGLSNVDSWRDTRMVTAAGEVLHQAEELPDRASKDRAAQLARRLLFDANNFENDPNWLHTAQDATEGFLAENPQARQSTGNVRYVATATNGEFVVTAATNGTAALRVGSGSEPIPGPGGVSEDLDLEVLRTVTAGPDGWFGLGFVSGEAMLWHPERNDTIRLDANRTSAIRAIAFSEDGSHVAVGSEDQSIQLLTSDGTYVASGEADGGVYHLAYQPGGEVWVSATRDGQITFWPNSGVWLPFAVQSVVQPVAGDRVEQIDFVGPDAGTLLVVWRNSPAWLVDIDGVYSEGRGLSAVDNVTLPVLVAADVSADRSRLLAVGDTGTAVLYAVAEADEPVADVALEPLAELSLPDAGTWARLFEEDEDSTFAVGIGMSGGNARLWPRGPDGHLITDAFAEISHPGHAEVFFGSFGSDTNLLYTTSTRGEHWGWDLRVQRLLVGAKGPTQLRELLGYLGEPGDACYDSDLRAALDELEATVEAGGLHTEGEAEEEHSIGFGFGFPVLNGVVQLGRRIGFYGGVCASAAG